MMIHQIYRFDISGVAYVLTYSQFVLQIAPAEPDTHHTWNEEVSPA
jgi:hypothetical protein